MPQFALLNLTGLPLTVESDPLSGSSTFGKKHAVAYITDRDAPDQVVQATIPSRRRRSIGLRAKWHAITLQGISDESSIRTEKLPLLDKAVVSSTSSTKDLPYKAFFKKREHPDELDTLLIIPRPDPSRHLSDLPDHTLLSDLLLPGTHDSVAFYGWPFTQCQDPACTLPVQLEEGIRFFDIRLRLIKGVLLAYHGSWPQLTPFRRMISEISRFLDERPGETMIVCIQQETSAHPDFSRTVREDMRGMIEGERWFLEPRVPRLGEVRGKAILMSRFGGGPGPSGTSPWEVEVDVPGGWGRREKVVRMGWRPNRWPDSEIDGFSWDCGETEVRTQDWYDIHGVFNIPAKSSVLTDHLLSGSHLPSSRNLTLSFSSAGSIPLALPSLVAKGLGWPRWGLGFRGINELSRDWLLDQLEILARARTRGSGSGSGSAGKEGNEGNEREGRIRGIIPMDYYRASGLVEIMLAFNAVGLKPKPKPELYARTAKGVSLS